MVPPTDEGPPIDQEVLTEVSRMAHDAFAGAWLAWLPPSLRELMRPALIEAFAAAVLAYLAHAEAGAKAKGG